MGSFLDYVTSSALSATVSGNTGISPFLTLLLLGVVEIANPSLLNMGETMEAILASWYSIAILSILTALELVGKCIPAVDEIIDSVEVFVVPMLSILATLGVSGVFDAIVQTTTDVGTLPPDDGERNLGEVGDGFLTAWKVFLVIFGMVLSLLIHFFKMIVRMTGLVCCMGCCQPCITVVEVTMVCCGVVFAILIGPIAILLCIMFLIVATYALIYKCRQRKERAAEAQANGENDNNTDSPSTNPTTTAPATTYATNVTKGKGSSNGASRDEANSSTANSSSAHDGDNDVENPLPPPSAPPKEEVISYAEVDPIPPPATNPSFVPSDSAGGSPEIPVAVAVAVSTNDDVSKPEASATVY